MTSNLPFWRGLATTMLFVLASFVHGWQNAAFAAELDCGAMAASLNPGDHYQFKLEIQSKTIRLEKGDDFCTEPASDWFQRQLILPAPARREMALPKAPSSQAGKDNAPLPASQENTPLPGQQTRQDYVPTMGLDTDDGGVPLPIAREFVKPKPAEEIAAEKAAAEKAAAEEAAAEEAAAEEAAPASAQGQQPGAPAGLAEKTKIHVTSDPNAPGFSDFGTGTFGPDGFPVPETGQESQVYGVAAPPPPVRDDTLVKRCDRDLVNFWSPGEHEIEGQKFWLSGVFTIDIDSDGRVDDVGFKIKAEGKIGNILNYFPSTEGRVSGKTVKTLKLNDERDISRLCPGNVTFERADPAEIAKQKRKISANRIKAMGAGSGEKAGTAEEGVPEEELELEPEKEKISNIVLVVAGIAMILLLAGGIGLALAVRNMMRSRKDEYEDDEDDYDDENNEQD